MLATSASFSIMRLHFAGIAQLVERDLAKVEVASSNLVSRSILLELHKNVHAHCVLISYIRSIQTLSSTFVAFVI